MESITDPILNFEAFAKGGDGNVTPFSLQIYPPGYEAGKGYYCFVSCPYFKTKPYQIFGVNPAQACELSVAFIEKRLEGVADLIDVAGKPVELPEIAWKD